MNEKIRELAEQAGITTNLSTDYFEHDSTKWLDYYSEKFAELLIRECASEAHRRVCLDGNDNMIYANLLAHFGVQDE